MEFISNPFLNTFERREERARRDRREIFKLRHHLDCRIPGRATAWNKDLLLTPTMGRLWWRKATRRRRDLQNEAKRRIWITGTHP